MGRQNLSHYKKDWKGGESEISTEYKRNMEIGLALGQWKGGMLVFDDEGKVLEAITTSTPTSTSLDKRKL